MSFKDDLASIYLIKIANAIQQGSFTGPIWANDGEDFTVVDIETDVRQGLLASKAKEDFFMLT